MCGIAGASLHPDEKVNMLRFTQSLFADIEKRGLDATGAAWYHPLEPGCIWYAKEAEPAWKWTPPVPSNARVAILHTRATTLGSELNKLNNHPVQSTDVWGVHNGVIDNHVEIFRKLGTERTAQVDTEAIFAAIAHGRTLGADGQPLLAPTLTGCLEKLEGSAAIAWLNNLDETETLRVARLSYSPLVWAQTKVGSFIFASTKSAITDACKEAGLEIEHMEETAEGTLMEVRQGRIVLVSKFAPTRRQPTYYGGVNYFADTARNTNRAVRSIIDEDRFSWDTYDTESMRLDITLALRTGVTPLRITEDELVYAERKAGISKWLKKFKPEKQLHAGRSMHAYAHVGDVVWTMFNGEAVCGEIYLLPNDFPSGSYIIRVRVGSETALVARTHMAFTKKKKEVGHAETR